MAYKPTLRKSGQVKQDNFAYPPEGNGWPDPLNEGGPQIRQAITNGSNGELSNIKAMSTSQQNTTGHHAPEGFSGKRESLDMGGEYPKTSQQKKGEFSNPEGQ